MPVNAMPIMPTVSETQVVAESPTCKLHDFKGVAFRSDFFGSVRAYCSITTLVDGAYFQVYINGVETTTFTAGAYADISGIVPGDSISVVCKYSDGSSMVIPNGTGFSLRSVKPTA